MNKKINKIDILYLCGLSLYVFSSLMCFAYIVRMDTTMMLPKLFAYYFRYFAYILMIVKILLNTCYEKHNLLIILIATLIFAISSFFSGEESFFFIMLIFIGSIGIDSKKIITAAIIPQLIVLVVTILLSISGIVENYNFSTSDRTRFCLGFSYCTVAPILYYFAMLGYIYIRGNNFKWYEALIMELFNYWLFLMTNTRMTFFVSTIFLVFFSIHRLPKLLWNWLSRYRFILIIIPGFCAVAAIASAIYYDSGSQFWSSLNAFLSSRLALGQNAINTYGFSAFGQPINWVGYDTLYDPNNGYNYVDSSYVHIALSYGFMSLLVILIFYSIAIFRASTINDYQLVFILMFVLCHALTEPRLLDLGFNPLIAVTFSLLSQPDTDQQILLQRRD